MTPWKPFWGHSQAGFEWLSSQVRSGGRYRTRTCDLVGVIHTGEILKPPQPSHENQCNPVQLNAAQGTSTDNGQIHVSVQKSNEVHENAGESILSRQVTAKEIDAKLPSDLAQLATIWDKIPVAVRQAWLATAEALTKEAQP